MLTHPLPAWCGWEVALGPVVPARSPTPLLHLRLRKGAGGAGLPPLGTAVAQSISPKPRKIFITKKQKKKKKKNKPAQWPPFLPAPRTVATGSGGLLGGWEPSGLDTQARVVEAGGALPPPGPLSPPPPTLQRPTRGGLPLTQPRAAAGGQGQEGGSALRWEGWLAAKGWAPASPHCTLRCTPHSQSWAFPPQAAVGTLSPSSSLCHPPILSWGWDCREDRVPLHPVPGYPGPGRARQPPRGGSLCLEAQPLAPSPPLPSLALIWAPQLLTHPPTTHLSALPSLPDTVASQEMLPRPLGTPVAAAGSG